MSYCDFPEVEFVDIEDGDFEKMKAVIISQDEQINLLQETLVKAHKQLVCALGFDYWNHPSYEQALAWTTRAGGRGDA